MDKNDQKQTFVEPDKVYKADNQRGLENPLQGVNSNLPRLGQEIRKNLSGDEPKVKPSIQTTQPQAYTTNAAST